MRCPSALRARLALATIVVVVPVLVFIVYDQSIERNRSRRHALSDMVRLAQAAATEQAEILNSARRLLLTVAELPEVQGSQPSACDAVLTRVLRVHSEFANLFVVGA